jgi:polar amino acid transport system substrate-binding protein
MRTTAFALLFTLLAACAAPTGHDVLTVAVTPDIPPFIMNGARRGIEIDLVQLSLPTHRLRFVQLPYEELQSAVGKGDADVVVGVQQFGEHEAYYSRDMIQFNNVAVVKRSAGVDLESLADLAGHTVLTWQDAWKELGPEFEAMYAPDGPQRAHYVEVADQSEQLRMFWAADADILIIDRTIFDWMSLEQNQSLTAADKFAIFPPSTGFRAAFRDAALRDAFDQGLTALCESGGYMSVLRTYDAMMDSTICEN